MANPVPTIEVCGAAEHNLKNIDISIERNAITVVTGVSGSGKSSLAFDTILAESQRRFFHTLSHYSRQFLDLQSRPAVKKITGLSPAISLAQNETQPSRRATVGTLTDASELIGVMFARFGEQLCPTHHLPSGSSGPKEIAERLLQDYAGQTVAICTAIAEAKKGIFRAQLTAFAEKGYGRVYIDGEILDLDPVPKLAREEKHIIKLIVDTITIKPKTAARLQRAIETAIAEGGGRGEVRPIDKKGQLDLQDGGLFAAEGGCPNCGFTWPKLDARYFSSNSLGKCEECRGYGTLDYHYESEDGDADDSNEAMHVRERTGQLSPCLVCQGTGLDPHYNAIKLGQWSPGDIHTQSFDDLLETLAAWRTAELGSNPAFDRVATEVEAILERIIQVGLGYLTMARRVRSLSGGEGQRLKLAGLLSENLRGVMYILDEPSQGLHPSEIEVIWQSLLRLKAAGNTVIMVDHDETFIRKADCVIDLGPEGGASGGRILAKFKPARAVDYTDTSITAQYLVANTENLTLSNRRPKVDRWLTLEGIIANNVRIKKVEVPIGAMTVVSGVSGAGKSSLVLSTLYPNLAKLVSAQHAANKSKSRSSKKPKVKLLRCTGFEGYQHIETVALVDRRPLAKSSVSMPATYLGIFTDLRTLFAKQPEAQIAGLTARDFSLNVEGGRCSECKGRGEQSLSMRFLADARIRCPVCKGARYRSRILAVRYKGFNLAEVLKLSLSEMSEHFKNHKKIVQRLEPAIRLGLGYLKLGQPSSSLSGGEAQRLKLVPHLAKRASPGTVIIMDEPTTGLHFADIAKLKKVLRDLVVSGATIIMIEHSRDMIAAADWLIDLGPGAAEAGGKLIYAGAPAGLMKRRSSVTSEYLH